MLLILYIRLRLYQRGWCIIEYFYRS